MYKGAYILHYHLILLINESGLNELVVTEVSIVIQVIITQNIVDRIWNK